MLTAATSLRSSGCLSRWKRRRVRLLRHYALVTLRRHRRAALEPHAVDPQILDYALDVVSRLRQRDALDPVDRIDLGVARIAVGLDPVADTAAAGVIAGKGHDAIALVF